MEKISVKDKVVLHLFEFRKYKDRYQYPVEITQEGIARALNISITHIPRTMKQLIELGYVTEEKGRVLGKPKKINVYFLTTTGMIESKSIIEALTNEKIEFNDQVMSVSELLELRKDLSLVNVIDLLQNRGPLEEKGETIEKQKNLIYYETKFENEEFFDRVEELKNLELWLNSKVPVMVIMGGRSVGKTLLAQKFLSTIKKMNIVFLYFYNNRTFSDVKNSLKKVLDFEGSEFEQAMFKFLRENPTILVADSYYLVSDDVVEFFSKLASENLGKSKVLVTMREDTPFYNRFYDTVNIDNKVRELKLKGFNRDFTALFLNRKNDETLNQIYLLTKGNPYILKLLKEKNEKKLKEFTNYTLEQIRLLIFLYTKG